MQHITANTGPDIVRGLRSILGSAVDVAGAGASAWTSTTYDDPAPSAARWEAATEVGLVTFDPDVNARDRGRVADIESLCDSFGLSPVNEGWELSDGPVPLVTIEGPTIACSSLSLGGVSAEDFEAEALRRHNRTLWAKIERAIWRHPSSPKVLAGADTVQLGLIDSYPIDLAFAMVEGALISRRPFERGIIWMPAGSASILSAAGVELDSRGFTREGTAVVFVTGVSTASLTGPFDDEAGDRDGTDGCFEFWMYGTPRLQLRLGAPSFDAAGPGANFVYGTNDLFLGARQTVAWGWAGNAVGVRVTVDTSTCCEPLPVQPDPEEPEVPAGPEEGAE